VRKIVTTVRSSHRTGKNGDRFQVLSGGVSRCADSPGSPTRLLQSSPIGSGVPLGLFKKSNLMQALRGLTVYFSCPDCSVVYSAKQSLFEQTTSGSFDCRECGKPVHSWSGRYAYLHWKPVARGET
jgi:predicted RNA-binding Zn-ribbon protein involved in translation (DUF1610 family)